MTFPKVDTSVQSKNTNYRLNSVPDIITVHLFKKNTRGTVRGRRRTGKPGIDKGPKLFGLGLFSPSQQGPPSHTMLTMGPRSLQPHTPPVVPTNLRCFCHDTFFHGIFCSEELSSVLHNYQQPNVRLCSSFIIACWISLRDNKTDPQVLAP